MNTLQLNEKTKALIAIGASITAKEYLKKVSTNCDAGAL